MTTRIGIATIAESPRDDIVPAMRRYMPEDLEIVEAGCLDGLTAAEIERLGPDPGEVGIVARLKAGGSVLLSHAKVLPVMQQKVDQLTQEQGAELVIIVCGADWSAISCDRLVVNPGRLFPAVIGALALGRKLGVIMPSSGQVESFQRQYDEQGIDALVTSASPYEGEARLALVRDAAGQLRDAGCDLIWMTCVGMDTPMRDIVAEVTGKPVILAHSLLARIVSELLPVHQPAYA